ncbi:MAG: DUF4920 domain-containing protein [Gammaproteobacteria bacterium]|nr:DUF4920 domain-containing protein [Gammaproteobacteria bacterium]
MKVLFVILGFLLMANAVQSGDIQFGDGADMLVVTPVEQVLKSPDEFLGKPLTVQGTITSVCKKKGCWMVLSSNNNQIRIKVNDGEMVFPFNSRNKIAFATGTLEALEMTQEKAVGYLSHLAEDAGQPFDQSSVVGDTVVYQLRPTGVTIKDVQSD